MSSSPNPLIYLASASPRRSALLTQIAVEHRINPVNIDESTRPQESPADYVLRLARTKAATLWSRLAECDRRPVLGADTTVALGSNILGKPANRDEGVSMLKLLSGQTHQVYTGVALCSAHGTQTRLSRSDVTFRMLTQQEMESYWSTGEPVDKAGGYAVQGAAAVFIERISGSYSGIVGLPLYETAQLLATIGWQAVTNAQSVGAAHRSHSGAAR